MWLALGSFVFLPFLVCFGRLIDCASRRYLSIHPTDESQGTRPSDLPWLGAASLARAGLLPEELVEMREEWNDDSERQRLR